LFNGFGQALVKFCNVGLVLGLGLVLPTTKNEPQYKNGEK
jgi:hypothetical protein